VLARGALASRRRPSALAAVAAHALVPLVATGGTALAPRDLPGRSARRLPSAVADLGRTVMTRERTRRGRAGDVAAQRAEYDRLVEGGVERFFEPRRGDCPLCGADRLGLHVEMPDLLQAKPGRFRLDRCGACGHIFQNPRLTLEGLDYYYRDFYDGAGEGAAEVAFRAEAGSYRGRATIVDGVAEPRRWLDVGAGYGHFCLAARSIWPKTQFDGLDISSGITAGEERGWVQRGHRGWFPELAPTLAGQYDVVSMHHYLEHTRDPGAELDAARTVLEPGGLLLIELPDPTSWLGRMLGPYWVPWMQPQHQHLLSIDGLEALLEDRGFTTLVRQRGEPHQPVDIAYAVYLAVNHVAPPVDVPWRPPPSWVQRWRRCAAFALATPLFAGGLSVDTALAPVIRRHGGSNAFRLLAQAPGG
jgi:SAM-dependent methyltransferase